MDVACCRRRVKYKIKNDKKIEKKINLVKNEDLTSLFLKKTGDNLYGKNLCYPTLITTIG